MSTWGRVLGTASLVGGVLGAAALGGVTAQRLAVRRYRQGGFPDDDFDTLPSDRSYSVVAEDGVALHVEEVGQLDAPLTVIFSHGWTLRSGAWHFQRLGLAGPGFGDPDTIPGFGAAADSNGSDGARAATSGKGTKAATDRGTSHAPTLSARLVFYDHRSHGRSSRATPGHVTLADLATDLAAVIATAAPSGPVAIVGHSMGGMAVLTLAGRDPEFFARRVAGVGLLSTSASEIESVASGWLRLNSGNPLLPVVVAAATRYPGIFERGRASGHDAMWLLTRSLGFADRKVPGSMVDYLDQMISGTPVDVIAEFAPALFSHDQTAALPALSDIPTVIVVGEADQMTPPSRAMAISHALPRAELVVIPGAGHMAIMEANEPVNAALRRMLVAAAKRAATLTIEPSAGSSGGGRGSRR
jgi:pimeloyl-ACP methyl ester carboxylesterase